MGQEGKVYLPVVPRMSPESFRTLAAAMAGLVLIAATCTRLCQGWDSFVLHPFFLLMGKGEGVGNGALI